MGRLSRLVVVAAVAVSFAGITAVGSRAAAPAREAAPTPYPGGRWAPPKPAYGVAPAQRDLVTMSDGAHIAVDIYYPADLTTGQRVAAAFPVLLTQTPYSGSLGAAGLANAEGPGGYFVKQGYIYVSADVRGTGRSGGVGGFFSPRDAQDGAELATWAAALNGSVGVVGLHGCSYLGATQLYTAGRLKPGTPVKAMIPACTKADPYRDTYMVNGIPAPQWEGAGTLGGAFLGPTTEASMLPKYAESQAGGDTAYYQQFWRDRDHTLDAPAIAAARIPTLLWNGWEDAGFGGLELYTALQNSHYGRPLKAPLDRSTPVTGRYQLIVGNWGHGGGLDPGIQLQWYDTWLRGIDTGLPIDTKTPLHVQEQVSGTWSNVASYPFTEKTTALMLGADGALSNRAAPQTRELVWAQPDVEGATLTYETAPNERGATVAGPGAVRVRVSSTTSDIQLMADLYDVDANGVAVPISHGGVLGSMHATDTAKSWFDSDRRPVRPYLTLEKETPLVAGQIVQLDIPLRPTVWRLEPGHKLRLRLVGQEETVRCFQKSTEITTDSVGCRARAGVQSRLAGATFTVFHGDAFLNLPLLKAGALPPARSGVTPTTPKVAGVTLPSDW